MKKRLLVFSFLLIAFGCSDSEQVEELQAQVNTLAEQLEALAPTTEVVTTTVMPSTSKATTSTVTVRDWSITTTTNTFITPTTLSNSISEGHQVDSYIKTQVLNYDPEIGIEPMLAEDGWGPFSTDIFECWLTKLVDELGINGFESWLATSGNNFTLENGGFSRTDALLHTNAWDHCENLVEWYKTEFTESLKQNYSEEGTLFEPVDTQWINCVFKDVSEDLVRSIQIAFMTNGESASVELIVNHLTSNTDRCQYIYDDYFANSAPTTTKAPTTTRAPTTTTTEVIYTHPSRLSAPAIGTISEIGSEYSFTVTWAAPSQPGSSEIEKYELRAGDQIFTYNAWETSAAFTAPNPAKYNFEVRAINKDGRAGKWSSTTTITSSSFPYSYIPPATTWSPSTGGGFGASSGGGWQGCYYKGTPMWGSVYVEDFSFSADYIVYVSDFPFSADLKVYVPDYSFSANSCGLWASADYSFSADFSVYYTDFPIGADFTISFVDYSFSAGR